jgi:hypothetical protein
LEEFASGFDFFDDASPVGVTTSELFGRGGVGEKGRVSWTVDDAVRDRNRNDDGVGNKEGTV